MSKGSRFLLFPLLLPSSEKRVAVSGVRSYRSISSRRGVASPAMDMGVLSIMGLGEGRGVNLCFCFLRSASFSCSHCSAILPQSMAAWVLVLQGTRGQRKM